MKIFKQNSTSLWPALFLVPRIPLQKLPEIKSIFPSQYLGDSSNHLCSLQTADSLTRLPGVVTTNTTTHTQPPFKQI